MKKYNVYDFINHVNKNKNMYTNYCEIIIDPYGNIIPASPSHQEAVLRYAMTKENKSRLEIMKIIPFAYSPLHWCIDKYGLIAVWYNGYIHGTYINNKPNRFQRKSLDLLVKNDTIKINWINKTREYKLYLEREVSEYE